MGWRLPAAALALLVAVLMPGAAFGQFVLNETFSHSTFDQAGWVVSSWQNPNNTNSTYTPTLTGGAQDADGSGWLRMTSNEGQQATYARLTTPIPSANNNVSVALRYQMWTDQGTGADGFTISLRDASVPFTSDSVGAFGGSLGYAQKDGSTDQTHAGMAGGYFSVGVDAYGNFSTATEGRVGGTANRVEDSIAVRGAGSGYTGYNYIAGTGNLTNTLGSLNFTGANTRPVDVNAANDREIVFNFTTENILTVSLRFGTNGTLTQVFQADLTNYGVRPDNLELIFTAGTGGLMQYTELQGLSITTSGAPVGTIYYSNYANDNRWGNGNNWGNAITPNLGVVPSATANLVFSNHRFANPNHQLTTAQNVDLGGNRSAGSVQFDAPFNYTLQGYTLTLGSGQAGTPTAITVTSAASGGAHTIQSAIALESDVIINTNTGTALNLSGAIAAGNRTFTLNNKGTTTISGVITGSGSMTQSAGSTGSTVLTGDNSSTYTGAIAVQGGTIRLGGSNILNAATAVSLSTANSFGTFDLANYNQTLGSLTFVSGGRLQTGTGTLTLGGNVTSLSSATTATIAGNLNLGSTTRTFSVADGGVTPDMIVTANISGNAGINKTGSGSLTLSGTNTFTGPNTFTAGTVIAGSNSALGTGASTLSSGATLSLQGGISLNSGTITVSGTGYTGSNGAIDNASGTNSLLSAVALGGNTRVGAAAGSQLTLSGTLSQTTASTLTAAGGGTIVLAGNNSYTGATTVNNGTTLAVASNNALGTNAAGTTVQSGATLGFQGGVNYTTAESVTVSGTGVGGRNGAIDNLSGNNTFAGPVQLAGATTIGANAGTQLTLGGAISGTNAVTAGGSGTVIFSGANTYTGTTTVSAGATLIAASNAALGTTGTATSTSVANGGTLGLQGGVTLANENISVNGTGVDGVGALFNVGGANTINNAVTLATSSTISAAAGSNLTLAGGISGGAVNLTKADEGTVTVRGSTSYTGTTTITGGTLAFAGNGVLGSASNIVVTNGTLTLDNSAVNNGTRISNTAPIALNDGSIRFIGNGSARSTETLGTVTATTGANNIFLDAGVGQLADLTISNLTRAGSATVMFTTDGTLGAGTTSAGQAGSPRVFLTQVAGVNTTGTLTTPGALPGWIQVTDVNGSANFAEYTGGFNVGNGVRAVTNYYTGALGVNVNQANANVLLNSASPVGAYTLTRAGTTIDGNLKITDAALVDLNTTTNRILQLNGGGLIKSGDTTTTISGQGRLTAASGGTLAVTVDNPDGVLNISAVIINNANRTQNPIGLTKSGAGLLTLTGANTFTGGVNLNDGTLRITAESGLGSTSSGTRTMTFNGGTLNIAGNVTSTAKNWVIGTNGVGTFDVDANRNLTLDDAGSLQSGTTGQLIKAGDGTLTITANNTGFNGGATLKAGTLELATASALGTNRTLIIDGGTLRLENNVATTFATNITTTANATIAVDRVSTGTNLTHTLGTVELAGGTTLTTTGANGFDLRLGAVTLNGAASFNQSTAGSDLTVGAIGGPGSITKLGAGNMTLNAAGTYTGATTVNAGILYTQGTNFLPTTTALTIADGAAVITGNGSQTLASLAGGTGTAGFNLGTGTLTVGDTTATTFGGTLTAAGLTKTGSGTLTLGGGTTNALGAFTVADGTIIAAKTAGDATGTGTVTVGDAAGAANSATLQLNAANQINNASAVVVNSDGRLSLNGFSETIGSLAGSGSVALGAGQLTLASNASTTFSGAISGTGGLTKTGTGTLTLSGPSTYSGSTTINAGTLYVRSSNGLGTGPGGVTIANGASLDLDSNISVAGKNVTLIGTGVGGNGAFRNLSGDNIWGGLVSLGGAATINVNSGNLYLTGGIATAGNTLTITGTGNTEAMGAITGTGGIVKNGIGALILESTGNSYSGATTVNAGSLQIDAHGAGPSASAVSLAAAGTTLNVNNYNATVGSLSGVDGSVVTLGSGTLIAGGNDGSTTFVGTMAGNGGSFVKTGTGTMTFTGANANSLSGTFAVNNGTVVLNRTPGTDVTGTGALVIGDDIGNTGSATVQLNAANQINDGAAVTLRSDGRLLLNNQNERIGSLAGTFNGQVALGSGTLTVGGNNASTTFSGGISGTGGLVKEGSGTLLLMGSNSYTGGTSVTGGILQLGATNTLATNGQLTIASGARVELAEGISQRVAGLTTSASSVIALSDSSRLTVATASTTTLLGGLVGTGTLAFTGGGNVTLQNSLNFGGTLEIGGLTIGGTPTTRLLLSGTNNIGTLRITGDTILDFGNSAATTLNLNTLIIDPNVKVSVVNWVNMTDMFITQNFPGAVLDQRGNAPVGNNASSQITFNGFTSNDTAWTGWHEVTPAPEPATYGAMMMSACLGLLGFTRWKNRRRRRSVNSEL